MISQIPRFTANYPHMTTTELIDVDLYCQRISYAGPRRATLDTLQALLLHHTHSIAFEDLDSLCGQTVMLDAGTLSRKLLQSGRGAYCFEHNTLLWNVLEQLGFKVSGLAARVRWNVPPEVITPIGHMALRIDLDGHAYLVDAGFGGITLTAALRIDSREPQATSHEPFRLALQNDEYTLQVLLNQQWQSLYTFELTRYQLADYAVWNWFTCTSPQSPFTRQLMAARPDNHGRHALRGNQYTFYPRSGPAQSQRIQTAAQLRECLATKFRLNLPDSSLLENRLVETAASSTNSLNRGRWNALLEVMPISYSTCELTPHNRANID